MRLLLFSQLHDAGLHQFLQAHEDAQLGVVPGEAALEVDGVRLPDGAVGGKLDGAALDKGAGGHDDIGVVAGHGPGLRRHVAVHRSGGLDALAEGHHGLPAAQGHRLDDVVAALRGVGNAGKAQLFIDIGGKNCIIFSDTPFMCIALVPDTRNNTRIYKIPI